MSKMFTNIIHRLDGNLKNAELCKFQQDEAHKLGIKTTLYMTNGSMHDPALVEYAKEQSRIYGDEIALNFNGMMCCGMDKIAESSDGFLYLHSYASKQKIVRALFEKFIKEFGFVPKTVGAYVIDAPTLKLVKEYYPEVECGITNCFEEGVKMYHGNNYSWTLFSDGGPWGAYYPSKHNSLVPAACEKDAVGIVGLPHLNRDMILALTSRDDYFASHPANIIRAKCNDGDDSPYMRRFIDKWIEQAGYNGYSYYNMFVSAPWLGEDCSYVPNANDSKTLYIDSLRYLKKRAGDGLVELCTTSEFAAWFRENVKHSDPCVNKWDDIMCGTPRQMFWYVDAHMRAAFDLNSGGELRDLRPYAGGLKNDMGIDSENLWNGNYPYLVSYEHRRWTYFVFFIHRNGKTVSINDRRAKCNIKKDADGNFVMEVDPIKLKIEGIEFFVKSIYTFNGGGQISVLREIYGCPDINAEFELEEHFRGCYGTTEYQEDMRSIKLMCGNAGETQSLDYLYRTRTIETKNGSFTRAEIGKVNTRVEISSSDAGITAVAMEGCMRNPFYTLQLKKQIKGKGVFNSCLKITKL